MEHKLDNGQAGVEVTLEMTEAGRGVLWESGRLEYRSPTSDLRLARDVFEAMEAARI